MDAGEQLVYQVAFSNQEESADLTLFPVGQLEIDDGAIALIE